ncbi:MAG: hypothetical protein D6723_04160 [Acidobacteria bacterium]|nr:MAG: hypothetical protein D6723_04160 [Acidobacteriota bacterium]
MYRPRFCQECGTSIERERWRPWHSLGFCEHCAPAFYVHWWKRTLLLIIMGSVMGFALGSWAAVRRYAPAPPLRVESQSTTTSVERRSLPPRPEPVVTSLAPADMNGGREAKSVSICGAPTKDGTPCQRRVKGGGRCWQHRQR